MNIKFRGTILKGMSLVASAGILLIQVFVIESFPTTEPP